MQSSVDLRKFSGALSLQGLNHARRGRGGSASASASGDHNYVRVRNYEDVSSLIKEEEGGSDPKSADEKKKNSLIHNSQGTTTSRPRGRRA